MRFLWEREREKYGKFSSFVDAQCALDRFGSNTKVAYV